MMDSKFSMVSFDNESQEKQTTYQRIQKALQRQHDAGDTDFHIDKNIREVKKSENPQE